MANNPFISNTTTNAMVNAATALANSGTLKIYTGTQPANANTAISGQTLLVTVTFGATAFANAVAGVATANSITGGTAGNSGTATWFRCLESNGTTVIWDGSVGTSGCDLNLTTTTINNGSSVSVTSFTFTLTE